MTVTINGTTGIAGTNGSAGTPAVQGEDTNTGIFFPAADTIAFAEGGAEVARFDSSGNLGIGTTSPSYALSVARNTSSELAIQAVNAGVGNTSIRLQNSLRHWSLFVNDGDSGALRFYDYTAAAERARIDANGNLLVGTTATDPISANTGGLQTSGGYTRLNQVGDVALLIGRSVNDGTLVQFYQQATLEGTISVSGTTVSYNGGHLSRWAQLPDNSRPELLKGTVMSNLDQMSNWDNEDNEQLNCVQISTVEGDPDVAGVFVDWDSADDGYNDILLAMTGDMVIRIGASVTVARGDLLMSAGDGTAKPQGDDIVRSKTIAKVTSTHVSHTYADGSYAVPCVLMAC